MFTVSWNQMTCSDVGLLFQMLNKNSTYITNYICEYLWMLSYLKVFPGIYRSSALILDWGWPCCCQTSSMGQSRSGTVLCEGCHACRSISGWEDFWMDFYFHLQNLQFHTHKHDFHFKKRNLETHISQIIHSTQPLTQAPVMERWLWWMVE